jgi:glutathione S-transferase
MLLPLDILGTTTSPYVRRVRIVAEELGLTYTLTDTFTEAGQARLRSVSPLWKVPVLVMPDGTGLWDSHEIIRLLLERRGPGPFLPADDPLVAANVMNVVDGALDSAVNAFYLRREGADPEHLPYLKKQLARVDAAMLWLDARLPEGGFGDGTPDLVDLALFTAIEWMAFRDAWPVAQHAKLQAFRERCALRPVWGATAPR